LLCHGKDTPQVFLGLANVLADDHAQVDTLQVAAQAVGEHISRYGFAGAAAADEQRCCPIQGCAWCTCSLKDMMSGLNALEART